MTKLSRIQTAEAFDQAADLAIELVHAYSEPVSVTWRRGNYVIHPAGQSMPTGRLVARYEAHIDGPRRVR